MRVHEFAVWHYHYTNTTDEPIAVTLGRREELIEPGETLRYTGHAHPDLFPNKAWAHVSEPVIVESAVRPL